MSLLRLAATFAVFLAMAACGDDEMPRPSGRSAAPDWVECKSSIAPRLLRYEVSGDTLTLRAGLDRVVLPRLGEESDVYGVWDLGDDRVYGQFDLRITGSLHIERERVSSVALCESTLESATVVATSPAIIDDTTIEILEADSETKLIVR